MYQHSQVRVITTQVGHVLVRRIGGTIIWCLRAVRAGLAVSRRIAQGGPSRYRGGHRHSASREDDSAARQTAARVQAAGARCVLVKVDITRQDDVERLFSITASQAGMVTGLVNNAGVTAHIGDLAATPVEVESGGD